MSVWKMAWRNVWRNKRRSLVTIGAMTFALCVEILYAGLLPGFMQGMENDIVDLEVGDMQVFSEDYLDKPSLFTVIDDTQPLLDALDAEGYPASARLIGGGLVASGEFSSGASFMGIDVARDATVSPIGQHLAEGRWVDAADPMGVVIGRQLARTLAVEPGDELIVLTQAADGSMANELFTVRGVLMSISQGTDRAAVFMNESSFREMMVFPSGAHKIVVRRPADVDLDAAATVVSGIAGATGDGINVMTWKDLNPIVAQMLEGTRGMIMFMFFIVYVAVGILILNAMLMAVFERIREFGVLKALGVGPLKVFNLILVESGMQACIAAVVGFVLALPGMWYLSEHGIAVGALGGTDMMGVAMRPVWYGIYSPEGLVGPFVMLFFVVGIAVAYPALKAAWIRPIEAMHHQ